MFKYLIETNEGLDRIEQLLQSNPNEEISTLAEEIQDFFKDDCLE